MKHILLTGFFAALLSLPCAALAATDDAEAHYQSLLTAAKANPDTADWQALRFAYADRPGYQMDADADTDVKKAMFTAMSGNDWVKVKMLAEQNLAINYALPLEHIVLAIAADHTGHADDAAHERKIGQAIFDSIRTGDGLSAAHAFTVIEVHEEYDLMMMLDRHVDSQSLSPQGDHSYDVLETSGEDGKKVTYYFQIDRVMAAETKMLHLGN